MSSGHVRRRTYERDGRKWTRYVATFEADPVEPGGRRRRTTRSFARKYQAEDWLATQRERAAQRLRDERTLPTVGSLLDSWLEQGRTIDEWSPRHAANSAWICATVLLPLRDHRVDHLTVDDVDAFIAGELDRGRSPHVLRQARNALSAALALAIRRRMLPAGYNVARLARVPEARRREPVRLDLAQVRALRAALDGDRLGPLYLTAIALGLRPGEVCGLRWCDVDLREATITVRQTIQHSAGAYHVRGTKTGEERTIPLPQSIESMLRRHRNRERELRGDAWRADGLVFPARDGGPLHEPWARRHLQAALAEAGLPRLTMYQLRHTGATLLLSLGVPLEQVRAILGHRSLDMTLGYAKVGDVALRDAADRVDEALTPRVGGTSGGTADVPAGQRSAR